MPLYMDFHTISDITIRKIKKAHIANQAVQGRYHVKYHQFWVNEAAGIIFCLMEGPDKEACEMVHREMYGNTACEIMEVIPGIINLFVEEDAQTNRALFSRENKSGDADYYFIMQIDYTGNPYITPSLHDKNLKLSYKSKTLTLSKIIKFQGREIKRSGDDNMTAVFMTADDAAKCAVEIQTELKKRKNHEEDGENISFKIGISGGQFITKNHNFFEETIQWAQRLSLIAGNQEIVTTTLVEKMSHLDEIPGRLQSIRVISQAEEKFLGSLFDIAENNLTDDNFSVESLSRNIGISRPQLYRKTISVTGHSPNSFIRNLRMQKAFSLIRKKQHNISEVALEVGINNPSYFSKCFQEKYGIIPSRVMC